MELVLGAILVLAALAFVIYPLLGGRDARDAAPDPDASPASLAARRRAIYQEILELELDYQVGKLDSADYHELVEAGLARAAALLAEEDAREQAIEQRIEREVAAMREALRLSRATPERTAP